MKLKSLYIILIMVLCCGVQTKLFSQFYGIEDNGNGSYTLWMNGGSITTNTQGIYSTSCPSWQNCGTYCIGCWATAVYGSSGTQYYGPGNYSYQQIQSQPPTNYSGYTISNGNVVYYDANGITGNTMVIPFGTASSGNPVIVGYAEGCTSCAQVAAQQNATQQWSGANLQTYQNQTSQYQQQVLAVMQQSMNDSYNNSNVYNYYYYYYAIQQLTNNVNGTNPLPPPPPDPPLPGPPNEKEQPVNTDNVAKLPAALGDNRTYVSPNGVPFILPPGAQVGALQIDYDDFPNGALFSFYINGVQYRADESPYVRNSAVGEPRFRGYYQVKPDNKVDLTKPYIPTEQPPISSNNNTILPVVRLRTERTPNGCKLVQEIVNYTTYPGAPSSLPANATNWYNHNTDIEFSTVVQGSLTNSMDIKCPSSGTGSTNVLNIDTWANNNSEGGISRLKANLELHTKNTVKVYLFDCATGNVKYTVTKSEYKTLTPAEQATETAKFNQQFNNNNFAAGDQDFVIKGCLDANGKWNYDVKLNPNSIANPHPKIAPYLQQIKDELKRQVDAEIQESKLKSANSVSKYEEVVVEGGEVFSKANMNIFEAISAIYDIGKDIINEGRMPEKIWDRGIRSSGTDQNIALIHSKSMFKIPCYPSGLTDELINQVTGALQLVKVGIDFLRHPTKTAGDVWNSVKSLTPEKIGQMLSSMLGIDNMQAGGDRAKYQTGKYTVQIATILISYLKVTSEGRALVTGAGDEMTRIQKFVPEGPSPGSNAIRNATDHNFLAKVVDDEKMITKNIDNVTGETKFVAIERTGDVYESKALNNMDEVPDDLKVKSSAGDLAEYSDDPVMFNEAKTQPQRLKDGKDFETRIVNDPATKVSVGNKAGIDLSNHDRLKQVQLKTSDGNYFIADEVYVKFNNATGKYDVVINESKLSNAAPFSQRQEKFMEDLRNGTVDFELRNTKFNNQAGGFIPQGATFNVKSFIKTQGDGTINGPATFLKYNPAGNTWQ